MWIIRKDGRIYATARNIQETNDRIVAEGGHQAFYNGKTFIDCKHATRLGDGLYEVQYHDARIYKVYGNLWVCMYNDKQIFLGTFDECEYALFDTKPDSDIERTKMIYKGQYEDCEYIASWEDEIE